MFKAFKRWRAFTATRRELWSLGSIELRDLGIAPGNIDQIARDEALLRFP
jgi:uncharacterized protein YjiS (DUF1127 family)